MAQSPIRFVAPSPGPATDLASTPPPPSLFRRESPTTAAMRAEREALEKSLASRRSTVKPVPVRPGVTAKPPAALERGPLDMVTDFAGDSARSLLGRGTIGTGEGAVGLANIATALSPANIGARAASALLGEKAPDLTLNPALDAVGYEPQLVRDYIAESDSEALKRARAEVEKAQGFLPTVEASLRNPSTIVQSAIESVPSMLAGQGVASGALKVAPSMAPILASALGEGALTAGQNAEQTRQESGTLTPGQAGAAVAAGGVTAGISRVAGRFAEKAGLADPDTLILAGRAASEKPRGLAARMIGGAISEGLLEEAPQSAQEQAFQNVAQGRPLGQGVMESAAQGMLTGGLMGAGSNVMPQRQAESVDNPDAPPPQYDAEDDFTSALLNPSIGPAQALAMGETAPPVAAPASVPAPAPSIRPSDVAGQIVWDAESQGRSPLSALIDSGLSTKDAKAVLSRVRANQPQAAAVPAPDASKVDAEQDKAAAARRAEAKSPAPAPIASKPTPRNATPEEEDQFLREAHDAVNRAASEQLRAEREARAERFATPWDNRFASGAAPAAEAPTADPFGQAERNAAFGLASSGGADVAPAPSPFEAKQEQFSRDQSEQQQAAEDAFYRKYAQDNGHAALVDALRTREGLSTSAAVEDAKAIEDGRPRKKRKPKPAQAAPADAAPSDAAGTPTSPQADSSSPRDASAQAPGTQAQAGTVSSESSPAAGTPERSSEPSPSSAPPPQVGESSDAVASTPRDNEGSTAAQESEQVDDIAAENTDSSADGSTTVTARGRDFKVERTDKGFILRGTKGARYDVIETGPNRYEVKRNERRGILGGRLGGPEDPLSGVTFAVKDGKIEVSNETTRSAPAPKVRGSINPVADLWNSRKGPEEEGPEANFYRTDQPNPDDYDAEGNEIPRGGPPSGPQNPSGDAGGGGVERQPAVSPANKGALLEGPLADVRADDIVVRPPVEGSRDNQPVADNAPKVSQGSAPQSVGRPGRPVSEANPQKDQRAEQGDEGGQSTESLPPKAKTTPTKSEPKEGQKYKFSSTQADLPPAFAAAVRELAAKIPDSALAGDGRKSDPHVTVKFGTTTNDAADVRKVLEGQGPITITFGKLSTFPPSESSDGAAVLKLDIYSSDLQALNKRIGDALENTETFKYSPHVTVAYVDPAQVDAVKAKLSNPLNGKTVKIDRLSFSDRQGKKHEIKLVAEPKGMDGLTKTQRAEKKAAPKTQAKDEAKTTPQPVAGEKVATKEEVKATRGRALRNEKALEQVRTKLEGMLYEKKGERLYVAPQARADVDGEQILISTGSIMKDLGAVHEGGNYWSLPSKESATVTETKAAPATPEKAAEKVADQIERVIDTEGSKSAKDVHERILSALEEELEAAKKTSPFKEITYQALGTSGGKPNGRVIVDGVGMATVHSGELKWDESVSEIQLAETNRRAGIKNAPRERRIGVDLRDPFGRDSTHTTVAPIARLAVARDLSKGAGSIRVQIPGDGTFTIARNPEAIRATIERIRKGGAQPWKSVASYRKSDSKPDAKPAEAEKPGGPGPIISEMLTASRSSLLETAKDVSDVRYGEPGTILFEYKGKTFSAPEPTDVMPAKDTKGSNDEGARAWAAKQIWDKKAKGATAKEASKAETKKSIGDVGEKIGGAKKDLWSTFKDKMSDALGMDLVAQPLSKSWPEPDYEAMIRDGADPWSVGFIRAVRDEVPPKPQKAWRAKQWAGQVEQLRKFAFDLLNGRYTKAQLQDTISSKEYAATMKPVIDRAELYALVGHEKSLHGVRIASGDYSVFNGQKFDKSKTIWTIEKKAPKTSFSNWPKIMASGDTRAEALDAFKSAYPTLDVSPKKQAADFIVYSYRGKPGFYIGKKISGKTFDLAGPFDNVKEARAYKDAENDALLDKLEKIKEVPLERRPDNRPRVGEDHRQGKDITADEFKDAFGFRGVEFGNWVEQGKRQSSLNEAYDALMDMAAILDIPPKAISLNGELGLAFGARGGGQFAAAHYESGKVVINLTKTKGAGSLGHEWWHALDNYFSRIRGAKDGFMTTSVLNPGGANGDPAAEKIRIEMLRAYGQVRDKIRETALKARASKLDAKRSGKAYWTTGHEMSARAFESYLISKLQDQNGSNDYLANIVDEDTWNAAAALGFELSDSYPYPTAGEIPSIRAAFDNFFDVVESKETDKGVALFERKPAAPEFSRPTFYSALERSAEQMKQPMMAHDAARFLLDPKRGAKAAEAKWTGLDDFLGVQWQDGKMSVTDPVKARRRVTPAEVQDFLKANAVTVTEVTKQTLDKSSDQSRLDAAVEEAREAANRAGDEEAEAYEAERVGFDAFMAAARDLTSSQRNRVAAVAQGSNLEWETGLSDEQKRLARAWFQAAAITRDATRVRDRAERMHVAALDHQEAGPAHGPSDAKFSQYQVPGGTNYKEVLLTLPKQGGWTVAPIDDVFGVYDEKGELWKKLRTKTEATNLANSLNMDRPSTFRSSHFDEPNILAHVRFNERTDANRKRVLFLEEIQSDWAQKGRREGFRGEWSVADEADIKAAREELTAALEADDNLGFDTANEARAAIMQAPSDYTSRWELADRTKRAAEVYLPLQQRKQNQKKGQPSAPFVEKTEDWTALALKSMLHYAAANGFDSVAWTTGAMQAARYDLSAQVERIDYVKNADGTYEVTAVAPQRRGNDMTRDNLTIVQVADFVGKEIAEKIERGDGKPGSAGVTSLTGVDLKVGGEGMKAFYDRIVPQVAEKLGKRFGAKVADLQVPTKKADRKLDKKVIADAAVRFIRGDDDANDFIDGADLDGLLSEDEAWALGEKYSNNDRGDRALTRSMAQNMAAELVTRFGDQKRMTVHSLDISPEMRASVREGQPLFTKRAATMTESQWQHYNARHDADRGESAREAYRRSETVNGAPTGVRVVDFEGDVDKQVVSMMVQWSAAIASKMGAAVHMLQRHVPALKFGGVTPAGNLHGVNVDGKVFVNYLATHQLALEVAKKERITYEEAFAREAVNVLIHEAAHYAEKGHGPAFEAEMDRIKADLGTQALASMLRDFRKYAANDQNRTRTQRMYEKAAPGWIEGERRGREAAANTGAAGARGADAQQSERLRPRPRSDTGGDQDSLGDDEPAGGVRMARWAAPVDVAGAPGLRRPDGRGVDPSFSRKPSASTPGLVAQQEANSDRLFRAFIRKQGGDIGDNETKGQYLQRKTQNRLNRLDRAESDAREKRGDTSAPILADRLFGGQARIDNKLTVTESVLLDPLMKSIRSNGLNFDLLGSYMQGKPDAIESVQKSGKRAKYDEAAGKIDTIYAVSDSYRVKRGLVTPEELDDIRAKREKARAESTAHPIFDALQDFERVIIQDEHNTGLQAVAAFAEEANDPGFARVSKVGQDGPRPNSVVFRRDGREWQIDFSSPEVADSVRKLHADSMNAVARFVSKGTRWVSRVNTVLSPAFMVKNKIRDFAGAVLSAMVLQGAPNGVSKSVAAKIIGGQVAAMRGTRDYIKNPAGKFAQGSAGWWAQQAHKNAAVPGYFRSIESLQRLESRLGDTLRGKMARKISFRHFSDVMMGLSELSEASTRVSVYRALVESGVSPAQAGDMARQTLDTNKTGDWTRNIGAITPFFNSSVQGAARLAQMMTSKDPGVRRRARAMMGGLVAAGAMLGAWLAAAGGDDDKDGIPDSDQQPEWDTQRNLIIGGVKIPLPQGFSAPFYAGFMLSKLGRGNAKPAEAMFQVGKAFWDQFTPISSPFGVAQPAADLLQNQTFTGSPIRPIRYPGDTRPNSEKFFKSNTGAAKAIAKGLNRATFGDESESGYIDLYPGDIDYVAKAGMGAFGRFMADSARAVEAIMDGKPVKKIPVVGDFLVDEDRNIQSRYYDAASMIRDADDRRRGKQRMAMRQELSERYPGSSEKIEGASLTELRKAMRDTGATLSPERGAWLKAELEEQDGRALRAKAAFEEASDRLKALDNMPDGPDKDEKRRAIYEAANRAFVAAVKVQ